MPGLSGARTPRTGRSSGGGRWSWAGVGERGDRSGSRGGPEARPAGQGRRDGSGTAAAPGSPVSERHLQGRRGTRTKMFTSAVLTVTTKGKGCKACHFGTGRPLRVCDEFRTARNACERDPHVPNGTRPGPALCLWGISPSQRRTRLRMGPVTGQDGARRPGKQGHQALGGHGRPPGHGGAAASPTPPRRGTPSRGPWRRSRTRPRSTEKRRVSAPRGKARVPLGLLTSGGQGGSGPRERRPRLALDCSSGDRHATGRSARDFPEESGREAGRTRGTRWQVAASSPAAGPAVLRSVSKQTSPEGSGDARPSVHTGSG